MNGEYTCELCHRTFEKTRSDDAAWQADCKDAEKLIMEMGPRSECAIICDDCYKDMISAWSPVKQDFIRKRQPQPYDLPDPSDITL